MTIRDRVTKVRDGDTIEVGGMAIRLFGIEAPELNERRGKQSKRKMKRLTRGKVLVCELTGNATYDRCEASCYIGGRDIAAIMVKTGHALDCPSFSDGLYRRFEKPDSALKRVYDLPAYCNGP